MDEYAMRIVLAPRDFVRVIAGSAWVICGAASGAGLDESMFSLGGFGTLGMVHSSEHEADFTTTSFKPNGAGYTRDWSADVDSLVAAQVTARFTPQLSAILQVMAQQNENNTYWPHVEWADVKYQLTPELDIRVGRTAVPTFLITEARNIGYSNPWVRAPVDLYGLNPITNIDGVDLSYRTPFGNGIQTLTASYGYRNQNAPMFGLLKVHDNWIITDTAEFGAATLHIAYQKAILVVPHLDPLFDAFREFGPQGVALADRYGVTNKPATFFGVGGMYDPGGWFLTAEWGTSDLHSALGRSSGGYVSGGYRLGKFTPYLTYGKSTADNLSDPGLSVSGLPPALAGEATALNGALNSILSTKRVQSTVSAGLRWDFLKNADLKMQVDHTRIGAGSSDELINLQPGYRPGGIVNLISIVVDFLF